ncbi:Gfo/Idh/MocA family protein [Spirochaetota bacterium]
MKKLNTALIGCGRIGFLLENDPLRYKPCTHYGGAKSAGIKINYACDINIERLKRFQKIALIPKENIFIDYKKLIKTIQPEVVIISTWTQSHDEISIMASNNGAKVIVLEKPIASSLKKSMRILDECKKNRTHLIINHERRYDNRYRKVKKIIQSDKIGKIKTVRASMLTGKYYGKSNIDEGGGPLLHDGTHIIDIIRYFFGDISVVQGEFQRDERKKGFEDRAVAWLKTKGGIDIFLETGGSRKYFVFELAISGTEGEIVIGNGYEKLFLKNKSKYYKGFMDLEEVNFPSYSRNKYFHDIYREVKGLLSGKKTDITSTGMDGYKALEVIHAAYLSSYKKRKPLKLPVKPESINLKKIFDIKKT